MVLFFFLFFADFCKIAEVVKAKERGFRVVGLLKGNRRERKHLTLSQRKKNLRGAVGLRKTLKNYGKIKQRIKGAPAEIQNTPQKRYF